MVRPSGCAKARYSSSNLKKKLSAVAPFAESGSGTGAPCGPVVSDHCGHAASKFDPERTQSQVALLGTCSSAVISFHAWALAAVAAEADHRGADVWGKAKVPVKATNNDYTLRSTVDNRVGSSTSLSLPTYGGTQP